MNSETNILYAVPHIEIEFGSRHEGYALYLDEDQCIKETKEDSETGYYGTNGGYYGPVQPLHYFKVQ